MNSNGKKARKTSGMNRYELVRAGRAKRHASLKSDTAYNSKVGTNARHAAKRESEKRGV